mgnify:CR=1 FL=1
MSYAYETKDFTHNGYNFRMELQYDPDMGPPWKEHDGHGDVEEVVSPSWRPEKRGGQRVMRCSGRGYWLYDWQGAIAKAKAEGWGLRPEARAELAARIGREPTKREVTAAAVEADFQHLRGWANDDWHWTCLRVVLLDVNGDEVCDDYVGGFESSMDDSEFESEARGMAENLLHEQGLEDGQLIVTRNGHQMLLTHQSMFGEVKKGDRVVFAGKAMPVARVEAQPDIGLVKVVMFGAVAGHTLDMDSRVELTAHTSCPITLLGEGK